MYLKLISFLFLLSIKLGSSQTVNVSNWWPSLARLPSLASMPSMPSMPSLPSLPKLINYRPCAGESTGRDGLCKSAMVCREESGTADGRCALGLGVCCLAIMKCGAKTPSVIALNNTYVVNNDYPSATSISQSCQVVINKLEDVTQVRLEFIEFDLLGPIDGECRYDSFRVSQTNQNSNTPRLCGFNKGQHIYLFADQSKQEIKLTISTSGINYGRRWLIKVVQLDSKSALLAPIGCLQHFTGLANRVTSFNFESTDGYERTVAANYAFCVRPEKGYCSLKFTSNYFRLNGSDFNEKRREDGSDKYRPRHASNYAGNYNGDQYYHHMRYRNQFDSSRVPNRKYSIPDHLRPDISIKQYTSARRFHDTDGNHALPDNSLVPQSSGDTVCDKNHSLLFPQSNGKNFAECGVIFNHKKPLIVTAHPYVIFVRMGYTSDRENGFDLSYEQLLCDKD